MKRLLALALGCLSTAAFAHGGEDHGAPPAPLTQAVAPRAAAATELFEVIAMAQSQRLVVFVDRYASNEPVAGAKVEIDGVGALTTARESEPGTYVFDLAAPLSAGKHALTISIEDGEAADLLSLALDTTDGAGPASSGGGGEGRWWWGRWTVGLALVLVFGFVMRRRLGARKAI